MPPKNFVPAFRCCATKVGRRRLLRPEIFLSAERLNELQPNARGGCQHVRAPIPSRAPAVKVWTLFELFRHAEMFLEMGERRRCPDLQIGIVANLSNRLRTARPHPGAPSPQFDHQPAPKSLPFFALIHPASFDALYEAVGSLAFLPCRPAPLIRWSSSDDLGPSFPRTALYRRPPASLARSGLTGFRTCR